MIKVKIGLTAILFTLVLFKVGFAWEKYYGNYGYSSCAYKIKEVENNKFIMVGVKDTAIGQGALNICIVKIDGNGDAIWNKIYNLKYDSSCGNPSSQEEGYDIITTADGNFVITGSYKLPDGCPIGNNNSRYIFLLKINSSGDIIWQKVYNNLSLSYDDHGVSVFEMPDSGFIVIGETCNLRTDKNGILIWQKFNMVQLGTNGLKVGNNEYICIGGNIVKINENGDTLWVKRYIVDYQFYGFFNSICSSNQSGYVLVGDEAKNGEPYHIYMTKVDTLGNRIWEKYFRDEVGKGYSVIQTQDGNYLMVGYKGDYTWNKADIYVAKFDENGDTLWTRRLGDSLVSEQGYSVIEVINGHFIIAGQSNEIIYAIELNENGMTVKDNKRSYENSIKYIMIPNPATRDDLLKCLYGKQNNKVNYEVFNLKGNIVNLKSDDVGSGIYYVLNRKSGILHSVFIFE